ncbi:MAG: MFS transporter [Clostridiales bacterium]|nr:MFS transporter [Clostridiales bacterium]MDD4018866.1 MFS transporter [Kiritimatiellia bacterium]
MIINKRKVQLQNIPLLDKIGYGVNDMGIGVIYQVVAAYLVFYATSILMIPGSLVGLVVSISVIWDGVTDPFMGYLSDQTKTRHFGRRHPYIIIGGLGTAAVNLLLWTIHPELSLIVKFVWLFAVIILLKTFTTICSTPYTALGAELSVDYHERTLIQGIRTIFFLSGFLLATVGGMALFFTETALYPQGQLNPAAYREIGVAASVLVFLCSAITVLATRKYIRVLPQENGSAQTILPGARSLTGRLRDALNNKPFRCVVVGYLFTNVATAFASTLGLHVFTYTFGMDNQAIAIIFGSLFIVSILSQPAWVVITRRIDKRPAVILGIGLASAGCVLLLLLVFLRESVGSNALAMLPFSILTGFGIGGLSSIPASMVADTIDLEEAESGIRSEGVFYGSMTLVYKIAQSAAILVLGILLDVIGFDASLAEQSRTTVLALGLMLSVGGLLSFQMARLAYRHYTLTQAKLMQIRSQMTAESDEDATY